MKNKGENMNTATLDQNDVEFDGSEQFSETGSISSVNRLIAKPEETVRVRTDGVSGRSSKNGAPKKNNRRRHLVVGITALAAALATGVYYYEFVAPYEATDDAFIEAHVTPIAPQVAGRVQKLFVRDNQEVKAGDVLLQIDPSDYQTKLDQAQANLAAANGRLDQANKQAAVDAAKVAQEKANVVAAKAEAAQAASDYKRYQAVGDQGISASQLDFAGTKASSSAAEVQAAQNKELSAEAQLSLDKAAIQTAIAGIQKSEADVEQAKLDLSYTQVKAPEDGYVTHRTVETGAYVQTGQPLLAIVPHQVWVVANFKETQLTNMRPGQPVTVKVDAYPQIKFTGHVDSIQHGSGASFSLLPPENASGNYVKVVQRVPVKILLDKVSDANAVLGPGMSVEPEVRVN
jgi:membrane fusion protein, multidrug efflux system